MLAKLLEVAIHEVEQAMEVVDSASQFSMAIRQSEFPYDSLDVVGDLARHDSELALLKAQKEMNAYLLVVRDLPEILEKRICLVMNVKRVQIEIPETKRFEMLAGMELSVMAEIEELQEEKRQLRLQRSGACVNEAVAQMDIDIQGCIALRDNLRDLVADSHKRLSWRERGLVKPVRLTDIESYKRAGRHFMRGGQSNNSGKDREKTSKNPVH